MGGGEGGKGERVAEAGKIVYTKENNIKKLRDDQLRGKSWSEGGGGDEESSLTQIITMSRHRLNM